MEKVEPHLSWTERTEKVFLVRQDLQMLGVIEREEQLMGLLTAKGSATKPCIVDELTLHRRSVLPVYGGPTLLEALWSEMDVLMERLMTGQDAEDGGDRFRAQELAWVIAIVTNAYAPSVDAVRVEAMGRWNAAQQEHDNAVRDGVA